jgi:Kre9/KNH-like N-terminal Ig-like domain
LQWNVTTPGENISLILRQGPSTNILVIGTIADNIPNTGSFEWNIPATLLSNNNYAVQIIVGPAANVANVGPDGYNFTPLLTLVNNNTAINTNTTVSATASTKISLTTSSGTSAQTTSAGTTKNAKTATSATGASTATATSAQSAAGRIESAFISGQGVFALVVALVVGMVASF